MAACFSSSLKCSLFHHSSSSVRATSAAAVNSRPAAGARRSSQLQEELHKRTADAHPDHSTTTTSGISGLSDGAINSLLRRHSVTLHTSPSDAFSAQMGESTTFLTAELQLLANVASDRAEMHAILAQQRDNWNKLFQRTLTSATMTACILSAMDGNTIHGLGLSLPALLLNAGAAAMMAIINQFQPSQLAEEQRTAVRLFRKLASDIHYTLSVSPHLRQSLPSFFQDCTRRLRALDKGYPMPLTPGGLEKFPAKVTPPALREPQQAHAECHTQESQVLNGNGWDRQITLDLKNAGAMAHKSDTPKYTGWAQTLVKVNKSLAMAAPCFVASAALLNAITMLTGNPLSMWSATCSVLATFANSISNDMQLGMVFELYRNSTGYYSDVEAMIQETLRMPVEERENGRLFYQRIAYQLGRWPTSEAESLVPTDAQEAGTLF